MHALKKTVMLAALACAVQAAQAQVFYDIAGPVTSFDLKFTEPRPNPFTAGDKRRFTWLYGWAQGTTATLQMVDDPLGKAAHQIFQMGIQSVPVVTDATDMRSEVTPAYDRIRQGRRWYAASVLIPDSWKNDSSAEGWAVVFQVHSSAGVVATSPPASITVLGDEFGFESRANYREANAATVDNTAVQRVKLGKFEKNKWYCFVMDADWQHQVGRGKLRLWMNGELVYTGENFPTHYTNKDVFNSGNYAKTGVYQSKNTNLEGGKREIYTDVLHIGGPQTTYEEIAAKTPCGVYPAGI